MQNANADPKAAAQKKVKKSTPRTIEIMEAKMKTEALVRAAFLMVFVMPETQESRLLRCAKPFNNF